MTHRVAVIDTNVVVSGLISKEGDSPAARILDGMLAVKFRYLLSPDLLVEYRNVFEPKQHMDPELDKCSWKECSAKA